MEIYASCKDSIGNLIKNVFFEKPTNYGKYQENQFNRREGNLEA